MGIISAIITFFLASYTFKKQEHIEEIYSNMSSHYGDTFSNMTIVKSFSLFSLKNKQLRSITDKRQDKQLPVLKWWGIIVSFSQVLRIIVSIMVIFYGSYLHVQGQLSI